jgi:hypothetical protein
MDDDSRGKGAPGAMETETMSDIAAVALALGLASSSVSESAMHREDAAPEGTVEGPPTEDRAGELPSASRTENQPLDAAAVTPHAAEGSYDTPAGPAVNNPVGELLAGADVPSQAKMECKDDSSSWDDSSDEEEAAPPSSKQKATASKPSCWHCDFLPLDLAIVAVTRTNAIVPEERQHCALGGGR